MGKRSSASVRIYVKSCESGVKGDSYEKIDKSIELFARAGDGYRAVAVYGVDGVCRFKTKGVRSDDVCAKST